MEGALLAAVHAVGEVALAGDHQVDLPAGAPDSESDDRADAHAHEAAAGGVEDADESEGTADADDTADADYIENAEGTEGIEGAEDTEPTAAKPYAERTSAADGADDADEAAEAVPEAVEVSSFYLCKEL